MIDAPQYYQSLYRDVPNHYVVVSTFKPEKPFQQACRVEDLEATIRKRASKVEASLFHTLAVFDRPPSSGRGTSEMVVAVPACYLDFDVNIDGFYEQTSGAALTLQSVKDELESWGLPKPSAICSSGHGLHFEYRFRYVPKTTEAGEGNRVTAILKAFNGYAIECGKKVGWKIDSMGDRVRVKRAVGSKNCKIASDPKPVTVLEFDPEAFVTLDELAAFSPTPRIANPRPAHAPSRAPLDKDKLPRWETIAKHCPFVSHCVENAAHLSYNDWLAVLGIANRCEDGNRHAHDLSSLDPDYAHSETETKLAETLKVDGPVTYDYIRNGLGYGALIDADLLAARMHCPIQFGYASEALIEVLKTTVYDLASERFFDLGSLRGQSRTAFDMAKSSIVPNPVNAFKHSRMAVMAARTDYLPGQPLLIGSGSHPVLNVYRPSGVRPVAGACDTVLEHFAYLIPDATQREHVLNYFAFMVQNPGIKLTSAVLLVGGQGNGKSTVARWLTEILGPSNVKTLTADAISSRFQADRTNIQLLVLNEVFGIDRTMSNALKSWITEDDMEVEEKGTPRFQARTPRGVLMISNHIDGLMIEDGDRRYSIIETTRVPPTAGYFERLNEAAKVEIPAFAHWLSTRDVSVFKPTAPAIDTGLKELAKGASRSVLDSAVHDAMEHEFGCFARDLFTTQDVIQTVMKRGWEGRLISSSSMGGILSTKAFDQLPQQRVPGHGRVRFWVWRNQERWAKANAAEIASYYADSLSPLNDNVFKEFAA